MYKKFEKYGRENLFMRQLMILEVSQKQAYIFESTRLSDNVERSEEICWVTDPDYFKAVAKQSGLEFDK